MLTIKMKLFADYYLTGMPQQEACRRAGYGENSKSSNNSEYIRKKASSLKNNPEIKEYIAHRLQEKQKKVAKEIEEAEEAILIRQNELLKYLSDCVRGTVQEKRVITYREDYEIIEMPICIKDRTEAAKLLFKYFDLENKGQDKKDDKPSIINDIKPTEEDLEGLDMDEILADDEDDLDE